MSYSLGMTQAEWILKHKDDTITLGELSEACGRMKRLSLDMARRAIKVGRDQDLEAYAFFMQTGLFYGQLLDLAVDILAKRYGIEDIDTTEGEDDG